MRLTCGFLSARVVLFDGSWGKKMDVKREGKKKDTRCLPRFEWQHIDEACK